MLSSLEALTHMAKPLAEAEQEVIGRQRKKVSQERRRAKLGVQNTPLPLRGKIYRRFFSNRRRRITNSESSTLTYICQQLNVWSNKLNRGYVSSGFYVLKEPGFDLGHNPGWDYRKPTPMFDNHTFTRVISLQKPRVFPYFEESIIPIDSLDELRETEIPAMTRVAFYLHGFRVVDVRIEHEDPYTTTATASPSIDRYEGEYHYWIPEINNVWLTLEKNGQIRCKVLDNTKLPGSKSEEYTDNREWKVDPALFDQMIGKEVELFAVLGPYAGVRDYKKTGHEDLFLQYAWQIRLLES